MQSFRRKLVAAAAVGLLASVVTLTNTRQVVAQSPGPMVSIAGPLPLPVRAVESEFQPVQAWGTCEISMQQSCSVSLYTVPYPKRLVVEYSSASANTASAGETFRAALYNPAENMPVFLPLIAAAATRSSGFGGFTSGGQAVRMYVGTSGIVRAVADRSLGSGTSQYFFTITGHLVNVS